MNYSKENTQEHKSTSKRKKKRARRKFAITVIKSLLVLMLLVILAGVVGVGLYAKSQIDQLPDISEVNISPEGFQTTIYDSKGNEIETLAGSGANREYVKLADIPKDLQHAFVAIEDSRFYVHNGIDVKGIIRAVFTGIANGFHFSQGASTITQQLLKNNYFTGWTSESRMDSINRKIQEQYLAVQLEKVTSKDTILENYLNTINLGQNTLGVEAASERYFNKSVSDINLSEAAVIAAITQNPSKYNPISHPEDNATRREKVLRNMQEQGYITEDQYREALADEVYDRIQIVNNDLETTTTTYFVDALTDQVMKDLMDEKGYTETQAYIKLYTGGLKIYATQVPRIQKICDQEINRQENYPSAPQVSFSYRLTVTKKDGTFENYSEQTMLTHYRKKNSSYTLNFASQEDAQAAIDAYKDEVMDEGDTIAEGGETVAFSLQPQAAMTVIDQSTGHVVALVGGRGDKTASKTLNRATGTTRQPGSTFKVIAAFAPALDAGGMTLASVEDDAPYEYSNGRTVHNYNNRYEGFTNIRQAITKSMNVVTVKTLTDIGTGLGYQYVENFGITTLESGDNNQALALGGISVGVTNLELTGAYATIANGGRYNRPVFYTTVEDSKGNVILDTTNSESKQVIKDTTAWLLTSAMEDVMTKGTGTPANFSVNNIRVAGKSGTTTKNRDTVFAGYTPYYTCVIWGGYDDNSPQSVTTYSKSIWKAAMSRIHEKKKEKDFVKPDGIVSVSVCKKSGKLPLEDTCDHDPRGSMVYKEYFAKGTEPKDSCDHHIRLSICTESGKQAGEYCPQELVKSSVFIVGAAPGSADSQYSISQKTLDGTCNIHDKNWKPEPEEPEEEEPDEPEEEDEEEDEDEEVLPDEPIDEDLPEEPVTEE